MNTIKISDISLRISDEALSSSLSFKEKLEIAKLLEKLDVDVIETGYVTEEAADAVLMRTLASTVKGAVLSAPVSPDTASVQRTWDALQKAQNKRLNLIAPTSTVQMEYICHMKSKVMLEKIAECVKLAASLGAEVEFTAEDATRSDKDFLSAAITTAVECGATVVTLCDATGEMLPEEVSAFITELKAACPALEGVQLSFECKDSLGLASGVCLAAAKAGANQIKVASCGITGYTSLEKFMHILQVRRDTLGFESGIKYTELQRTCQRLEALTGHTGRLSAADESEEKTELTTDSDMTTVRRRLSTLGYDVSDEDMARIYTLFMELAAKKKVDDRDLEALVAESARQVAPTYQLESFVINSGSSISSTAFIQVNRKGVPLQTVSIGDGPIDAAFLAIDQLLGHHFELEDFRIQAVTEGREAQGDAVVKLRANGKLYSGRGLSTDIIEASIRAYLSAVNKIVHEENAR
ncbi:MAG: hypothetical protein J6Q16_03685 [Clostridia bacterium]|nr:hypothetical protein [Clostridia bacterium]